MIQGIKHSLPGFPWKGTFKSKFEVDRYFSHKKGIQCLICGRFLRSLQNHLQQAHGVSNDEYRERYGLPWRKGLVSKELSLRHSASMTNRIKSGTIKHKPDNKAAVKRILAGFRRPDQPYLTNTKSELANALNRKKTKYRLKDFQKVLSVMSKKKVTLSEACRNYKLPSKAKVFAYARLHPDFRKKLMNTYYRLPYSVQARAQMCSPQFYRELKKLKKKDLSATEIGKALGISYQVVQRHLKKIM